MAKPVRRLARKILSFLLGLLLAVGLLVSAVAFVVVARPEWVLREPVLLRISALLRPDVDLRWETLRASSEKVTFLKRRIRLHGTRLCATLSEGSLHGCFERAEIAAVVDFARIIPKLDEIGPIELTGGDASFRQGRGKADEPAAPEEEGSGPFRLPSVLTDAALAGLRIELDRWRLLDAKGRPELAGELSLRGMPDENSYSLDVDVGSRGARSERADLKLRLRNDVGPWSLWSWRTTLAARGGLPGGIRGSIEGELQPVSEGRESETVYRAEFRAEYRQKADRAKARVGGTLSRASTNLKLDASFSRKKVGSVELAECSIGASDRGGTRPDLA